MGKSTYSSYGKFKSIVVDDLVNCAACGRKGSHAHHIFEGPDKPMSEKFHLMIPLCESCHYQIHNGNQDMNRHFKELAQKAWEKEHPMESFRNYFRKSYL